MLSRRSLATLLAAPLLPRIAGPAWADEAAGYPEHSVRMIVPYPPGGGGDAIARVLTPKLQEALGQTVIIDNRPGAGASIGTDLAAKAPPDGYTILETPGAALTVNPQLMKVPYDPVRDLMPVAMLTRAVLVFAVNAKSPIQTVKDLVTYAKANPGKFNFGSAGNGTITQLSWEMLKLATGTDMVHVPYKGSGPAINDLMGGRVQGVVESVLLPYIRAGQMRAIAVGGDKRWQSLPDVPSMAEAGYPSVRPSAWYGVFAPRGTSPAIVAKLSALFRKIVSAPEMAEKLDGIGMVPEPLDSEDFAKVIRDDIETNGKVIREAHITLD